MITGFLYVFTLVMSETYKKTILTRRIKRRNTEKGNAAPTGPSASALLRSLLTATLIRPVHMLVTEPIVALLSLYTAFAFGILFAFIAAFPVVFEGVYGFNAGESGLPFIAVALGVTLAAATAVTVDRLIYQKKHHAALAGGRHRAAPEHRLYLAMFGSVGLPVGLFWFAWTAKRDIHWIVCIVAAIPFAWGNMCIFVSGTVVGSEAVLTMADVRRFVYDRYVWPAPWGFCHGCKRASAIRTGCGVPVIHDTEYVPMLGLPAALHGNILLTNDTSVREVGRGLGDITFWLLQSGSSPIAVLILQVWRHDTGKECIRDCQGLICSSPQHKYATIPCMNGIFDEHVGTAPTAQNLSSRSIPADQLRMNSITPIQAPHHS